MRSPAGCCATSWACRHRLRRRGWRHRSRLMARVRSPGLCRSRLRLCAAAGRDDGYLLRGSRLDQFDGWLEAPIVSLTAGEQGFLSASCAARNHRHADEEARRQREPDTARQLVETERRRAEEQTANSRKLRRRAGLLAVALALAGMLAVTAVLFARSSGQNAALAATCAVEANANAALAVDNANLALTRQAEAVTESNQRATAEVDANTQRDTALAREREALQSFSLSLAANARQALDVGDQPLALLLALAANTVENPPLNAWRTLLDVAYAPGAIRPPRPDRRGHRPASRRVNPVGPRHRRDHRSFRRRVGRSNRRRTRPGCHPRRAHGTGGVQKEFGPRHANGRLLGYRSW